MLFFKIEGDGIKGLDCINGSAIPQRLVPPVANYTQLHKLYLEVIIKDKQNLEGETNKKNKFFLTVRPLKGEFTFFDIFFFPQQGTEK